MKKWLAALLVALALLSGCAPAGQEAPPPPTQPQELSTPPQPEYPQLLTVIVNTQPGPAPEEAAGQQIAPGESLSLSTTYGFGLTPRFQGWQGELPYVSMVTIYKDDELYWEDTLGVAPSFAPPQSGSYRYEILVQWQENAEPLRYTIELECSLPTTFSLDTNQPYRGDTLAILVENPEKGQVACETNLPVKPNFFPYQGGQIALLPLPYTMQPGSYTLSLTSGASTKHFTIEVLNKQFEVQYLQVEESVAESTVNSQEANNEFSRKITPVKAISDPQKHWAGRFIMPVEPGENGNYRITSEFGLTRYVNDDPNPSRHAGIDLPKPAGSPVFATGGGRVAFAGFLQLTGNTVVIEHGFGLKSFYYHMQELLVATDEPVEQGQTIGRVGSTGFSTGPHLHFALAVNSTFINPWTAIEQGIIDKTE